jgi:Zn-dependent protease
MLDRRKIAVVAAGGAAMAVLPALSLDVDPVELAMTLVLLVVSLGIHEAAHGWVALKCGDTTARDLGRITLNPIPHIDLFMTILLPAMLFIGSGGRMLFGGAKPVPVSFHRLRHPWRDMSLVAIAGPLSNFLLAIFFMVALKFFLHTGLYNGASPGGARYDDFLPRVLYSTMVTNVLLAVFNLVPIPPLDGSRVMAWLLPDSLRPTYVRLEGVGMIVIFALLYMSHDFRYYLYGSVDAVVQFLDLAIPIGH